MLPAVARHDVPMLIELAIGDAYGAGFEYVDAKMVREQNLLEGYVQHPTHLGVRPGSYTDDTQMTLAIAELMVDGASWTPEEIAGRFVDAFKRDPRDGYARGFQALLQQVSNGSEFLRRIRPDSDKSGAAMRVSPVGLLADVDDVVARATVQARVTHETADGVDAACAAALAVHYCRHEVGPLADVGEWIADRLRAPRWAEPWAGRVGSKGVVSVRAALTALSQNRSMRELLRACVGFTGDVDTVATIALAAASCSPQYASDLPTQLIDGLERGPYGYDYLKSLDRELVEH